LYQHHRSTLSDSQTQSADSNVFIVDSTTISLFGSVLKGVGRNPITGKKKGGIKAHTAINSSEDVPCLVKLTAATVHDSTYLKQLHLPAHSWIVFDKGYTDYNQYDQLTKANINFVTRERDNASYKSIKEYELTNQNSNAVLKDEKILVAKNPKELIMLRRVVYWDNEKSRLMIFVTNNHHESPDTIAHLYKKRWQIELLFKRLKQNFPLKYFLGDSANAINPD
jgi:IS4 transposase